MAHDLLPAPPSTPDTLASLSLADAPDYFTAVAAGEAHGLAPTHALKASFGKWLAEHADAVQHYGLANFYDGKDAHRAFVNYTRLLQFLCLVVAEQGRELHALRSRHLVEPAHD